MIIRSDNIVESGSGQVNQKAIFKNLTEYLAILNALKSHTDVYNTYTNFSDIISENIIINSRRFNAAFCYEIGHILGSFHEQGST